MILIFFYKFEVEHNILFIVRRKSMYLQTCGSFESAKKNGSANSKSTNYKSTNHKKRLGLQIANPHSATFAESTQNLTNY